MHPDQSDTGTGRGGTMV